MFGIHYLKASPTQYVLHYQSGRLQRAGPGLAFFYYRPTASIVVVPVGSADVPFIFNEISGDFQPLTVQGQLTYRVSDPQLVASLLDYRVEGAVDSYVSDDGDKLPLRLVNLVQVLVRAAVRSRPLREAMQASDEIVQAVSQQLIEGRAAAALGVEPLAFSIQAIRPTPEVSRALEADMREELLQEADRAIYDRRNAAVEQERRIKENELETEIAVEEKKRQIRVHKVEADLAVEAKEQQVREVKLAGQIHLENERTRLISARADNARIDADAQSYAMEASLRPLMHLDKDLIDMLAIQTAEPRRMVSLAFKELASNAARIGSLNISPDLLEGLLREVDGKRGS